MTQEKASTGTTLARGVGSSTTVTATAPTVPAPPSVVRSMQVAAGSTSRADGWPDWARDQLEDAVRIAGRAPAGTNVATLLHRDWFLPHVEGTAFGRPLRPLAGIYRSAHAGTGVRRSVGELTVLARHDVVAADGWWRTWGESWTPPRARPDTVRIVLTPHPGRLAAFVRTVTGSLLDSSAPWGLACATRPSRMRRAGGAVLQLPDLDALPETLLDDVAGLLHPAVSPLGAPLIPGAGLVVAPTNGMTFGEHRCHLIAVALRQPASAMDPLGTIASVFAAHGVRPSTPWRTR
jgi:type III HopA1-like effector protein